METHSGTEGGDMHVTKTVKGEAGASRGALWENRGHMYSLRMLCWCGQYLVARSGPT